MRIYLSGGIAAVEDPEAHFTRYAGFVNAYYGVAVNPMDLHPEHAGQPCPPDAIVGKDGHTWACHLRVDLTELLGCDGIAMLPGWERSHGARLEHLVASSVGIRVFYFRGESRMAYDGEGYPLHQVIEDALGLREEAKAL